MENPKIMADQNEIVLPDSLERELRECFRERVGNDFRIVEEVRGTHLLTGASVRADLICHPSVRLCEMGFPMGWFVIETKHLDFGRHESKRLYESFWQATSYCHSEFSIDGNHVRPIFSAFVTSRQPNQRDNGPFQAQKRRWQILMELGVYANVAFFDYEHTGAWLLKFGQARLFHSQTGLSKVPRGLARYVGSRALSID